MRMNALLLAPNLHPLWMSTRRRIQLIGPAVGSNVANGERSKEIRRAHKTTTAACPQTDGYSQKSYSTATNTGSLRQGQTEVLVLLGLQLTWTPNSKNFAWWSSLWLPWTPMGDGWRSSPSFWYFGLPPRPRIRGSIPGAWRLLKAWHTNEIPNRVPPFPENVVHSLAGYFLFHQNPKMALSVLLGFYGMLRTGELLGIRNKDVIVDLRATTAVISLGFTNGGKRTGAAESVSHGSSEASCPMETINIPWYFVVSFPSVVAESFLSWFNSPFCRILGVSTVPLASRGGYLLVRETWVFGPHSPATKMDGCPHGKNLSKWGPSGPGRNEYTSAIVASVSDCFLNATRQGLPRWK